MIVNPGKFQVMVSRFGNMKNKHEMWILITRK